MVRTNSLEEVQEFFQESADESSHITQFLKYYSKARETKKEPCSPEDDCTDLLSSCCGAILTTVFGTLPLQVECSICKQCYLLKDVISK